MKNYHDLLELSQNIYSYHLPYSEAKDLWQRAVYYNKLQNSVSDPSEQVCSQMLYNEQTDNVESFVIRAKKQWSRKQYFVFLLGASLCTYSYQGLKAVMINEF
jgi:hypothetical protein